MTGTIPTSIDEIVNRLSNVKWQNVLFEAITNSLQAHATELNIKFYSNINDQLDNLTVDPKIKQIIIEDNGNGFIAENIDSFKKHMSSHKKSLGCKGIGRFFFLKKFEKVSITSLDKVIDFRVDIDIDKSVINSKMFYEKTSVSLENPKEDIFVNFDILEQMIKEHFLADFKLRENPVVINVFLDDMFKFVIRSTDTPSFEKLDFKIGVHKFTLLYLYEPTNKNADGYYCAGNRVVIKNSQLDDDKKWRRIKEFPIVYILMSDYFTEKVNDSRDNFDIFPKLANRTMFNELAWSDINAELTNHIKLIAKSKGVDLANIAQINLHNAIEKSPYLIQYLQHNDDMLDSKSLVERARKSLERDKEKLRNSLLNDMNFINTLYCVTQAELAEYIFDRQKIIDKLKMLTEQGSLENKLHDLFMKRKSSDDVGDYRTNNLWLFDDRFMSYDKVFSDKQIKEIFPQLADKLERPDILSIVSNTYEKDEITDIVVIELKKSSEGITPARAEEQLLEYADFINQAYTDRKIRIWTYAFLRFDDDTEKALDRKGYNRVFTKSKYPICYCPFPKVNTIINFIDYFALAEDADNRNHTFMKILHGTDYKNKMTS